MKKILPHIVSSLLVLFSIAGFSQSSVVSGTSVCVSSPIKRIKTNQ